MEKRVKVFNIKIFFLKIMLNVILGDNKNACKITHHEGS